MATVKHNLRKEGDRGIVLRREYLTPTYARVRAITFLSRMQEIAALRGDHSHRQIAHDAVVTAAHDLRTSAQKIWEKLGRGASVDYHAHPKSHIPRPRRRGSR